VPPAAADFAAGKAAFDEGDYTVAYRELLPAAEAGDARAQVMVGFLTRAGAGTARDEALAVRWFEKAAAQGSAEGEAALGVAYFTGRGVARDYAQALSWFTRAADHGDASAQANLGLMHLEGHGVDRDETTAVRWFEKAAELDESRAQIQLGIFNAQGQAGVAKNLMRALFWFTVVARKSDDDLASTAMNLGNGIIEEMTDDDVMEAQRLARAWRDRRD
jgi:TPR repeat protein